LDDLKKDGPYLSAVRVIRLLRKLLPRETIVTTEVGQNQMWAAQHYFYTRPNSLISSGGLGTMGFELPASLGVKIGKPEEIASVILFMASQGAEYLNGATIVVDGGRIYH
jgi:thiamine pyrophosphate-dependent acetolactate synthase large subunit-like protein